MSIDLKQELIHLIKKEGLDKAEIYYRNYEHFEEIPLYSRWYHIDFLSLFKFNEKNKVLIKLGIELIESAYASSTDHLKEAELKEYFICLTITNWDDYEEIQCLGINVFISRKKSWLLPQLDLRQKSSIEENLINEYLLSLNKRDFAVFVTNEVDEESKRVYILKNYYAEKVMSLWNR